MKFWKYSYYVITKVGHFSTHADFKVKIKLDVLTKKIPHGGEDVVTIQV